MSSELTFVARSTLPALRPRLDERPQFATREDRDEEIVRLALRGMSPARIEQLIHHVSRENVYAVLRKAREAGTAVPYFSTSGTARMRATHARIRVRADVIQSLATAAALRGISEEALAQRIVEAVADRGLTEFVLDDGGAPSTAFGGPPPPQAGEDKAALLVTPATTKVRLGRGEIKRGIPKEPRLAPAIVAARLAEIPEDGRTITQRVMGDPLPGRSALDARRRM